MIDILRAAEEGRKLAVELESQITTIRDPLDWRYCAFGMIAERMGVLTDRGEPMGVAVATLAPDCPQVRLAAKTVSWSAIGKGISTSNALRLWADEMEAALRGNNAGP